MSITSVAAKDLARIGANIEITPNARFTSPAVMDTIRIVASKGRKITIHAESYTTPALKDMVRIGGDSVTIVM